MLGRKLGTVVSPSEVAEAFGIGRPIGPLVPVQHTVSETWRLTTDTGSFLVKQLWPDDDPEWASELDHAMAFEKRAAAAGIRTPPTVQPRHPAFGWTGRVEGRGAYRVTEWLEHRKVTPEDNLTDWVGQTLATLHGLESYAGDLESCYYIHGEEWWRSLAAEARSQQRFWASLLTDNVETYIAITERLRRTHAEVADHVITHRDLVPYNVLLTDSGPVLVDWEVIGPDSASLEAGFAAVTFGFRDTAYIGRILDSYAAHGGVIVGSLGENLFAHKLGWELGRLASLVHTTLEGAELTGWQTRYDDPDRAVGDYLVDVLEMADRLDKLATDLGR